MPTKRPTLPTPFGNPATYRSMKLADWIRGMYRRYGSGIFVAFNNRIHPVYRLPTSKVCTFPDLSILQTADFKTRCVLSSPIKPNPNATDVLDFLDCPFVTCTTDLSAIPKHERLPVPIADPFHPGFVDGDPSHFAS